MIDVAIILAVDKNKDIQYEEDSKRCIFSWRKRGGQYKDIPIYAINLTNDDLSRTTLTYYEKFNVSYIKQNMSESNFGHNINNKILVGLYAVRHLPHDIYIQSDVDMYLLREPTGDIFEIGDADFKLTAADKNDFNYWERYQWGIGMPHLTDSCLFVYKNNIHLHEQYYSISLQLSKIINSFYIEEYAFDYMLRENLIKASFIDGNIIYYTESRSLPLPSLRGYLFLHEHSYPDKDKDLRRKIAIHKAI